MNTSRLFRSHRLYECRGSQVEVARDFSYRELLSSTYGLSSLSLLDARFESLDHFVYVAAEDRHTGELQGVARADLAYDFARHANLSPDVLDRLRKTSAADIGAYVSPEVHRGRTFHAVFFSALHLCRQRDVAGIYIQIRPQQTRTYLALGFEPVSEVFRVPGWKYEWRAFFLDIPALLDGHADPAFRAAWERRHGVRVRERLWADLAARLVDSTSVSGSG